jgi:uncharacterized protein DUF6286
VRAVLRVLAPLIGLVLAAAGVLLVIEVVAAWLRPLSQEGPPSGVVVPWPQWRAVLEELTWRSDPVPAVAVGVAVVGLVLLLVGLLARRSDVLMDGPEPGITVTTSPRVLAQLVGRRVRATDDVAAASVTASRRRIAVTAQAWGGAGPQLPEVIGERVDGLLDRLPLHRRPRVSVSVSERKGPR